MGMYGHYIAIDNSLFEDILLDGNKILELEMENHPTLDIDKSWEAIYYTLCGDIAGGEAPLCYIVPLDGKSIEIEDEDFEFFSITANQVKEAIGAMEKISKEDFRNMFSFEKLVKDEVYPSLDENDNAEEFLKYLSDNFEAIRVFYQEVSSKNMAIIFYLS